VESAKRGSGASCADDLAEARRLSRLLAGEAPAPTGPAEGFVRFGAPAPTPEPSRPVTASPAPPRPAPPPSGTFRAPPPPVRAAPPVAPPAKPPPPAAPAVEPLVLPDDFGPAGWNRVLDACLQAIGGEAALLMDPSGLVVASRGPRPTDELEGIGARLMIALEQAEAIEGGGAAVRVATIELPARTLFAARLDANGTRLTLGLLAAGSVAPARRQVLEALLRRP